MMPRAGARRGGPGAAPPAQGYLPCRARRDFSARLVRKRCLINPNSDFLLQSVGVVFFKNAAETGEEMELA